MQIVITLCFIAALMLLVLTAGIAPRRSPISHYELQRRKQEGDVAASEELARELAMQDVVSLQKAATAVLLVVTVLVAVGAFGWLFGTVIAVVVALAYGRLSQFTAVRTLAGRLYVPYDAAIVRFVQRNAWLGKTIRSITLDTAGASLSSREELEHLVGQSGKLLTPDEKKLIINGLHFNEKTVESIMTPRGVIASIGKDEIIGPLVLDDLHKTGHSRFPVADGDIDHVIGVLHIRELLSLGSKATQTVEQAMEKKVYYIREDQTLDHALAAFLRARHHLFVVVNGYRETVGIVTLEDVVEALLGRKIVDEFDVHDDLRVVALRNAKLNNNDANSIRV